MYVAIDFDGTCVTHEYPNVGKDIGAIPVLKKLVDKGHQLILFTMRSNNSQGDRYLDDAVNWFKENGIELFGINVNPTQKEWTCSPKAYAHLYIDDAALGIPLIFDKHDRPYVDWKKVEELLFEQIIL